MRNHRTPKKAPPTANRLTEFFLRWKESEQRLNLARQTLAGAEREELEKQARFLGAIEYAAGGPASWTYNPDDGVTFVVEPPKEIESAAQPVESPPKEN